MYGGQVEMGRLREGGWGAARSPPGGVDMIRVALADDQELVRTGFRMILESEGDIRSSARRRTEHRPSRSSGVIAPMSC